MNNYLFAFEVHAMRRDWPKSHCIAVVAAPDAEAAIALAAEQNSCVRYVVELGVGLSATLADFAKTEWNAEGDWVWSQTWLAVAGDNCVATCKIRIGPDWANSDSLWDKNGSRYPNRFLVEFDEAPYCIADTGSNLDMIDAYEYADSRANESLMGACEELELESREGIA